MIRAVVFSLGLLLTCRLVAQSSAPGSDNASGHTVASPTSGETGFSIESEVLTYTVLRSNSKAVGREIAAYINGSVGTSANVSSDPGAEHGNVKSQPGVVILSSNTASIASFQLWRADMELMRELRGKSKSYCPGGGTGDVVGRRGAPGGAASTSAAAGLGALAPFSAALPLVQGLLGMASTTESVSPVRGTIEDQAFMNAVAMELRARNLSVLIPDIYMPLSLSDTNANSPFLSNLNELLTLRACLTTELAKTEAKPSITKQDMESAKDAIDFFLNGLMGTGFAPAPEQQPENPSKANSNEKKSGTSSSFSPAHLISVLQADGLAQRLLSPQAGRHILWLKALESGGSVTKTGNFLSTKVQYSGGAVGSYALFNPNGELECSGNVYSYAGPLRPKEFRNETPLTDFNPIVEQNCQTPGQRAVEATH